MTMQDEQLDRLGDLVARLEALGITPPPTAGTASVNPDGSPGHVAPGELIESAWGNAVADEFHRVRAGYVETNAAIGPLGPTVTAIPGLSIPVQFLPTRVYRLTLFVPLCDRAGADSIVAFNITGDGFMFTETQEYRKAGERFSILASVLVKGTSATMMLTANVGAVSGTVSIVGGSGRYSYLLVEEISPSFATT